MVILITILTTTFFILLIYSFFYFLRLYYKRNKEFIIEVEDIRVKHEQNILSTKIEIQEQTFENISREIHDNIGQKLSLAKLHLNILKSENSIDKNDKLIGTLNLISAAIEDLGDLSRSISADFIQNNGLIKAIEFEVRQLKKLNKFDIHFILNGETLFLTNQKELIIFRVLQESLNNIIKHANCSQIRIWLSFGEKQLILGISDNGIGFNQIESPNNSGNGLGNMKKRADSIGANLQIQSASSKGTQLILTIPYDQ